MSDINEKTQSTENSSNEIDEIMAELDQLQKEVPEESPNETPNELTETVEESNDPLEDIRAEGSTNTEETSSLDDSFGEMKQDDIHTETSFPGDENENNNVTHLHSTALSKTSESNTSGKNGVLSMTLSGEMSLELKYAQGGDEVTLCFEEGFFSVKLNNGAEFKVPLQTSNQKNFKKTA